jgi:4-hydroxy-tetrahydrodipicolinate synthase
MSLAEDVRQPASGTQSLSGVIAAIATPITPQGDPDEARFITLAKHLLATGCDGLNVLGTTGEATSFTVAQRRDLMAAIAQSELPMQRLMVGTGAAALGDAVALTRHAAELGFAGALVLPPFYYKGVPDDGIIRFIEAVVHATGAQPIPIYLYHFPALSGVPYTEGLVRRLLAEFGERIAGLKDSSGDLDYARRVAVLSPGFRVFPSNEGCLGEARKGTFAGCISATANLNADLCAQAFHGGNEEALAAAVAIRKIFDGVPLVPGVKSVLAHIHGDAKLARVMPPLSMLADVQRASLADAYGRVRAAMPDSADHPPPMAGQTSKAPR